MANLSAMLELNRCPHCHIDLPNLIKYWECTTTNHKKKAQRYWRVYKCNRCGGLVTAAAKDGYEYCTIEIYPVPMKVEEDLPKKAKKYLEQAIASIHAPAGAVMLAASSVDAMLKEKKYTEGNLKARIEKAADDHLITSDMKQWAHKVRLDANDQRHADQDADFPTEEDAKKVIEFTAALGMFLFVLPARVQKGLEEVTQQSNSSDG